MAIDRDLRFRRALFSLMAISRKLRFYRVLFPQMTINRELIFYSISEENDGKKDSSSRIFTSVEEEERIVSNRQRMIDIPNRGR